MRLVAGLLLSFLTVTASYADDGRYDVLLNKVTMRLSSEQWVTTKTALVTIGVNASVNDAGLEKIQDQVLKKVTQFAPDGDWHIVSFDRSQDTSGLEKVVISAQARLPSAELVSLRDKAKAMTKPGETYTLDNVEYTPSEDEIRAANISLRSNVYQQAKEEIDRLNKMYPTQTFYMHNVDFVFQNMPMPVETFARVANAPSAKTLVVGDKLQLSATVVLAAMPDHGSLIKNIT